MSFLEPIDDEEMGEDELEMGYARWQTHNEISAASAKALIGSKESITSRTCDEFLLEASQCATMLVSALGDADGMVADLAGTVHSNLAVVSYQIQRDPVGFLLSCARAIESDDERKQWVQAVIDRLSTFVANS